MPVLHFRLDLAEVRQAGVAVNHAVWAICGDWNGLKSAVDVYLSMVEIFRIHSAIWSAFGLRQRRENFEGLFFGRVEPIA